VRFCPEAPTQNPTHTSRVKRPLDHLRREPHFPEERALCPSCLIAVTLCIEIERRLDARMTQNALTVSGSDFTLLSRTPSSPIEFRGPLELHLLL
jgi:hypothetical protein